MVRRLSLPLLASLLVACATSRTNPSPESAPAKPEHPIVSGCTIQNTEGGLLWSHPAQFCLFLPDGRFVTGGGDGVSFYSADRKRLWHRPVMVHHMMSLAANGDILVLSSEWKRVADGEFKKTIELLGKDNVRVTPGVPSRFRKEKFRIDKVVRLSPEGKVVSERGFFRDGDFHAERLQAVMMEPKTPIFPTPFEGTHINSVYEIGPNASPIAAFKAGNIVINENLNGVIMILDPELKRILWQLQVDILGYVSIHDVQILPNGNLLLFRNVGTRQKDSSLDEVDPLTLRPVWRYFDLASKQFRAPQQGSVQRFADGRHLFAYSHAKKPWVKMLDRDGKVVWQLDMSGHSDEYMQGAYALPVESFLQHSRPL